jgi:uncharacterized membrane protein YgcG
LLDPTRGQVLQYESSAINESNRLMFQVSRRMGRFMTFGNYTLSWSKSNGDGIPADSLNLLTEWGRTAFDRRHNFSVTNMTTLPKNFRLSLTVFASSGSPFNITTGRDDNQDGSVTDRVLSADGKTPLQRNADLPSSLYGTAQFNRLICPPGQKCTLNKVTNQIEGQVLLRDWLQQNYPNGVKAQSPGLFDTSASLSKTISFGKPKASAAQAGGQGGDQMGGRGGGGRGPGGGGPGGGGRGGGGGPMIMGGGPGGGGPMMMGMGGGETGRYSLTFTVSASNLFNRVNFGAYSGTLGSSFFGRSSSASSARQVDFNVRFGF